MRGFGIIRVICARRAHAVRPYGGWNDLGVGLGKKIMVIGSPGSGKTTLACRLGDMLKLPVIHLDKAYWNSGWIETPREEWIERQQALLVGEEWIVDGNYGGTIELRLQRADAVVFLDYNRWVCLYGVLKRWLMNWGKTRPDMPEGCPEAIDFAFLKFVWQFPKKSRVGIVEKIARQQDIKQITIKNRRALRRFLAKI